MTGYIKQDSRAQGRARFSAVARACAALLLGSFLVWAGTSLPDLAAGEELDLMSVVEPVSYTVKMLGHGTLAKPVDSGLNPSNALGISRRRLQLAVRPDFRARYPALSLVFKPRAEVWRENWREGIHEGETDTDTGVFVNEWLARANLPGSLFLSYGREVLLWGPSYLVSPSNPFIAQNGRDEPKTELPGSDYARLVWAPLPEWTVSMMANTAEGRREFREDFDPAYAVKLDTMTEKGHASIVLAKKETADPRFGFFGLWNVSDAFLLYAEGSFARNDLEQLAGISYTRAHGTTVACEYFYNDSGIDRDAIEQCAPPLRALDDRERLLKRNYLLLQYIRRDLANRMDVTLRMVANVDDGSRSFVGLLEYPLNDYVQLFGTTTRNTGDTATEFGSILIYATTLGVEITF